MYPLPPEGTGSGFSTLVNVWAIPIVSEMLGGHPGYSLGYSFCVRNGGNAQVIFLAIPFVLEMLGDIQAKFWVIPFMPEMLGGTQVTFWAIPFVSEMLKGTQLTFWLFLSCHRC